MLDFDAVRLAVNREREREKERERERAGGRERYPPVNMVIQEEDGRRRNPPPYTPISKP
jgi:hypothetical protein